MCDFAEMHGEARSHNGEKLENYVNYFEKHCLEIGDKFGCEVNIEKMPYFLPFHIEETSPICRIAAKACERLGIEPLFEGGGGGMDGNILNSNGVVSVGVATGYSGNHTKEEQLVLEDFFKSGELAAELIKGFTDTL